MKFIKTQNGFAYVVQEVDASRNVVDTVFGISVLLYCYQTKTPQNAKGTITYSDYIDEAPVNVCGNGDIVEQREANEVEKLIYSTLHDKHGLSATAKEYLRKNFKQTIDNR